MKKVLVSAAVVLSLAAFSAGALAGSSSCTNNCCKAKAESKDPTRQDVVIDPVCGMDVKVSEAKYSSKYDGKAYYFCSKSCQKAFEKRPSEYIGKAGKNSKK